MDDIICEVFIVSLLVGYSAILLALIWWSLGVHLHPAKTKIPHWLHLDRREHIVRLSSSQRSTPHDCPGPTPEYSPVLHVDHSKPASSDTRIGPFVPHRPKPWLESNPPNVSKFRRKTSVVTIAGISSFDHRAVAENERLIVDDREVIGQRRGKNYSD